MKVNPEGHVADSCCWCFNLHRAGVNKPPLLSSGEHKQVGFVIIHFKLVISQIICNNLVLPAELL